MREILFRGKRIDNGEWVCSGNLIHFNEENECYIPVKDSECICTHDINDNIIEWDEVMFCKVAPETVGQYTGLTDKNGKRIFEGDIVKESNWHKRTFKVEFDEGRGGWYPFACGDGCGCCEDEVVTAEWCEVIGNVHDHPELIAEVEG